MRGANYAADVLTPLETGVAKDVDLVRALMLSSTRGGKLPPVLGG
jgi:hypothetical protein